MKVSSIILRVALTIAGITIFLSSVSAGPLYVLPQNPRYFTHDGVTAVYLTGSHTWHNLVDGGGSNPPTPFDYGCYLDFLEVHNLNFFRLWAWEQTRWTAYYSGNYYFSPHPFQRTGPGTALDGLPKFDLNKFNQAYFDRLRSRVQQAADRGIYVSIMLFDGWSLGAKGDYGRNNPWKGHPFNAANNINNIDGDVDGDGYGHETQTMVGQDFTAIQEAYVTKVIETVNDFDNVLYEISNESEGNSENWQYHMINFIKAVESGMPKQHPVGMTVEYPNGSNQDLYNSPADWISPNGGLSVSPTDGRKVVIADTDHLCGICGDYDWGWRSFTCGQNPLLMDLYDGSAYGIWVVPGYDPFSTEWVLLRKNLGYTLAWARRADLAHMTPRPNLTSTQYCLANPGSEYIVYSPGGDPFTLNLGAVSGDVTVEWRNLITGDVVIENGVAGGSTVTLTPPFSADGAAAYIHK